MNPERMELGSVYTNRQRRVLSAISVQIIVLNCYLCNVLKNSGRYTYGNTEIPLMTKLIQMYLLLKLCGVIDGKNIL